MRISAIPGKCKLLVGSKDVLKDLNNLSTSKVCSKFSRYHKWTLVVSMLPGVQLLADHVYVSAPILESLEDLFVGQVLSCRLAE